MPHVSTNDGIRLTYQDEGAGAPILIVPGWSQTASMFEHQVSGLSDRYRMIAMDNRGHGESEKPTFGYRIYRLAKDVHDLIEKLGLEGVNLMGWSMGCSVVWAYYDLFGPQHLARLILVDEPAMLIRLPEMTDHDAADAGALWNAAEGMAVYSQVHDTQEAFVRAFVPAFLTELHDHAPRLCDEVLKMPSEAASALLLDHLFNDWRDVIPRISIPTLVFGADKSHVPVSSQQWIHDNIPGSQLEIMEGRAHLSFYEEPERFNQVVADFIG